MMPSTKTTTYPRESTSKSKARIPAAEDSKDATSDVDMEENVAVPITEDSLERLPHQDMIPKNILTGMYGSGGKRVRHTVHEGAMKLPATSIEILNALAEKSQKTGDDSSQPKGYLLPGLDDIHRPTMDSSLSTIRVTDLGLAPNLPPPPSYPPQMYPGMPQVPEAPKWKTVARQRIVRNMEIEDAAQRIRGGGDNEPPADEEQPPYAEAAAAPDAANSEPAADIMQAFTGGEAQGSPPFEAGTSEASPNQGGESVDVEMTDAADQDESAVAGETNKDPASRTETGAPEEESAIVSSLTKDANKSVESSASGKGEEAPEVTSDAPAPSSSDFAAPAPVTSSAMTTAPAPAPRGDDVIPLVSRPASQWEQHGPGESDEMPKEPKTPPPSWYSPDKVSDLERIMLPEWFDGSASHRTPESYRDARERIIKISDKLGNRYVTSTHVRRTVSGDAGSLARLHGFLVTWGFINEDALNDSTPTGTGLREEPRANRTAVIWTETAKEELAEAVLEESAKRRKLGADGESEEGNIDWNAVAARMQNGAGPIDCERAFLYTPLPEGKTETQVERSITPDMSGSSDKKDEAPALTNSQMKEKILREIIDQARPEVIKAATDAALRASQSLAEAQRAAIMGLVAGQATERALREEESVSRLMTELHEQRLQKLENRLALMDDVEGMLEAERVALELERRDLYTARCRHWFSGAS